jgi:hypothetical protein
MLETETGKIGYTISIEALLMTINFATRCINADLASTIDIVGAP